MAVFWRRIVDEPHDFLPELWQLFLRSSLAPLGGNYRPVLPSHDMEEAHYHRQGLCDSDAAVGRGQPINVRWFEVAIPGGVEYAGLNARTLYGTRN